MYCRGSRDVYSCIAERAEMDADVLLREQGWIQLYCRKGRDGCRCIVCRGSMDGYSCIAERAEMDADVL